MSCPRSPDHCPYQSETFASEWSDRDRSRHCIQCGEPAFPTQDLATLPPVRRDLARSAGSVLPGYYQWVRRTSKRPVTLAGRHVAVVGTGRVYGFSLDGLGRVSASSPSAGASFLVDVSLPASEQPLMFAAPHLYWIRHRRLERVNLRQGGMLDPEVVTEDLPGTPLGMLAWGRGTDGHTHVAIPGEDGCVFLALPPGGTPTVVPPEEMHVLEQSPSGSWHRPVFVPSASHWVLGDFRGRITYVDVHPERGSGESAFRWSVGSSEMLVSGPQDLMTQPRRVGDYVFVAIRTDEAALLGRLGPNGVSELIRPGRRAVQLLPPATIHDAVLSFEDGVLWPSDDSQRVLYVPADASTKTTWLSCSAAADLHPQYAVGGLDAVIGASAGDDAAGIRLTRYERTQQELEGVGQVFIRDAGLPDVQSMVLAPGTPVEPPTLLVQFSDRLLVVYQA